MKKLICILCILSIISIFIGVVDIDSEVLLYTRIPRLVSILISGIGLSIAGLILQHISQNKFAAPSTVGTMDCAILGLTISLLLYGNHHLLLNITFGFVFAIIGTKIVMYLIDTIVYKDKTFIPIIGLMFGKIIYAISLYLAYKYDLIQDINSWLIGDFSIITQGNYEILYLDIPMVIIAYLYSISFTIIGCGNEFSSNIGVDYNKIKNIGIFIVAMLSSSIVLTVGNIPFIGLIIPNLVSLKYGDNIKITMPYVCVYGAILVLVCDIFSRLIIYPFELPVSIVLTILGSIAFIYLFNCRRSYL